MRQRVQWWRDRWFVLAAAALAIHAVAVGRVWRTIEARAPEVVFRDGSDEPVVGQQALVWQYRTDQVAPGLVGVATRDGPYAIHPRTDGQWTWTSPRRVEFQPDQPWAPGRTFLAHGFDPTSDTSLPLLSQAARYEFRGEPLRVESVSQVHLTGENRLVLRLVFNAPPRRDAISNHLQVLSARGYALGYQVDAGGEASELIVRTKQSVSESVTVRILRGLPPAEGDLGLPDDVIREVQVHRNMVVTRIRPVGNTFQQNEISVEFSQRPDTSRLAEFIAVEPATEFTSVLNGSSVSLVGGFESGASYRVVFRAGLLGAHGAILGEEVVRTVSIPHRPSGVRFPGDGRYLSGAGRRLVSVQSVNTESLSVTAEWIYPNNLVAHALRYETGGWSMRSRRRAHDNLSRVAGTRIYSTEAPRNRVVETQIDMAAFLGDAAAGVYWLTARTENGESDGSLAVVSDLGIHVRRSDRQVLIWVNSLSDARPVEGAEVRLISETNQDLASGVTDASGILAIDAADFESGEPPWLVWVSSGEDCNYLPLALMPVRRTGDIQGAPYPGDGYEAAVYSDRGIFRPGETGQVHVAVRGPDLACPEPFPIRLRVRQPDQQVMRTYPAMLSELGTAHLAVSWPEHAATGPYTLEVLVPGGDEPIGRTALVLEAFVPPGIAVDLTTDSARLPADEPLRFEVEARHLFGPPAAGMPVRGAAIYRTRPFRPDGWEGFSFGDPTRNVSPPTVLLGEYRLDDAGRYGFETRVPATLRPPAALDVLLQGKVMETGGRSVSAYGSRQIDVYPYYLGVRPLDDGWPQVGADIRLAVAAVGPDGSAMESVAEIEAEVYRVVWSYAAREVNGRVQYENTTQRLLIESRPVHLAKGRGSLVVTPEQAGQHEVLIRASASDIATRYPIYVSRPGSHGAPARIPAPDAVELAMDRPLYRPGDTARLRIEAPFTGTALLTIESDRVLKQQVLRMTNRVHEVDIPVEARYLPNVYCCVTLLRPSTGDDDLDASHRAVGVIPLAVEDPGDRLAVQIEAPVGIRPQSLLNVQIQVLDSAGQPVQAEVTMAAVDEGIRRLTEFQLPDPLAHFRRKRALGMEWIDLYGYLMEEAGLDVEATPSSPAGDLVSAARGRLNPIRSRRFRPTSLYAGPVMTDAAGRATLSVEVPEFTGELSIMAVAVAPQRMGAAQQAIQVKRPLVVRSSLPRFLAPEDRCEVPVEVFNETAARQEVRVGAVASGPLTVEPAHRVLTLEAGESGVVMLDLRAVAAVGVGELHLSAEAGEESYQEQFELPVRPVSPRLIQTGAGSVAAGEHAVIHAPSGWLEGTEEFSLGCSGQPSLSWAGGLDYLLQYPYGCLEQTVSSVFPLLFLADLAAHVQPGSIEREEPARLVEAGIWRLLSMQTAAGGFTTWPGQRDIYEWGTVYAAHFLVEASGQGHQVPPDRLELALEHIDRRLARPTPAEEAGKAPDWLQDRMLRAYECRVLTSAGKPTRGWLNRLLEEADLLPLDARIHLAVALAADRRPADGIRLLAAIPVDACFETARLDDGSLDSPPRSLALLLSAWLRIDPLHPSIPALVLRLEETSKQQGRWSTTQENAMALLALGEYSRHLQHPSSATDAGIDCGNHSHTLSGNESLRIQLPDCGPGPVHIRNRGDGPVYYAWRSAGVPMEPISGSIDRGCRVRRVYLSADGSPLEPAVVRQGQPVWVEIEISPIAGPLRNLAVVDLLPAGLEIEQWSRPEADRRRGPAGIDPQSARHLDARDDRMLIFSGRIAAPAKYRYLARAVTPGLYRIPRVAAEGMYSPGVYSVHGEGMLEVLSSQPAGEAR